MTGALVPMSLVFVNLSLDIIQPGEVFNQMVDAVIRAPLSIVVHGTLSLYTGLLAGALTEIAGSSDVFERGFVTYSNAAKIDCLGVSEDLLIDYGAVSEQVARMVAMKAATDAADDMIKMLSRRYNRARQSQITNELLDIIGGAEALK